MTAQSYAPPAAAIRPGAAAGWLYGPAIDLLIGAGGIYLVMVPLLIGLDQRGLMTSWPIVAVTLLSLFISGPHYGATILRVYDRREDRRQYALFAIWATAALVALFVAGLHSVLLGSFLVTLYVTWNPWHFSGQNYGISLMFLRRRGVEVDRLTRRLLYASFVCSFLLAILVLHSIAPNAEVAPQSMSSDSIFRFQSLGIPRAVIQPIIWVTAAAYLVALGGAGLLLLRRARPRDLLPVACIALMQSLWFALPAALPTIAQVRLGGPAFTAIWLSAAHSAQYLWVTSFYASQQDRAAAGSGGGGPALRNWWARTLLAGSTVTILPGILFAPALLGTVAWDNGLWILLVSVVNLHHFVLDGAVWKLRDGRVARLLLRDVRAGSEAATEPSPRIRWGRTVLVGTGIVSLAVALFDLWQRDVVINRAGDDNDAIVVALERLRWIGREPALIHTRIGNRWAQQGRLEDAIGQYRRSLEIHESPEAWRGLGAAHARRGQWQEASVAYRSALALHPKTEMALSIESELRRVEALGSEALRAARGRAPPAGG
jgi:hypothetical protein